VIFDMALKPKSPPVRQVKSGLASQAPKPFSTDWLRQPVVLAGWLVVLVVAAYLPALHSGFIWDDDAYVTENLTLRSPGGLWQIWSQLAATPQYYPLVHTSFWLEYHLWELNPLGYHVDNVLLHILASLLLWRVLVRLRLPGAWLAAAIFALHPVMVESVAWITERKNVLAAVFYYAAALAYWRWGEPATDGKKTVPDSRRWYFIAFALFVAALLSKTITCSLPATLLLIVWWQRGRIAGREVWPLLPFFGVGAALGLLTSWLERNHVGASGPEWAFSLADRCLIAGRAVWFYAGKLCWPADLMFIYPRWQIDAGVWWQWLFPLAALGVVMLLWCQRERWGRGPLVAVLYFGGTLFPALGFSNVYPMRYSFVADHFQYLATVGLIILAVSGLGKIIKLIPVAMVVLPLGLGIMTWARTHIYANPETLWRDTLAKNPAAWMAHDNLGNVLYHSGQVDEAISQYRESLRLKPDDADAHYNLGFIFRQNGQIDEAISQYQEALRLKPDYVEAHNNLGYALLMNKGQTDLAISQFKEALRLRPNYFQAHNNLGIAHINQGRLDEAISQFQEVVRLNPDYVSGRENLARALSMKIAPASR